VVGINAMVAGGMGLAVPSHLLARLLGAGESRPRLGIEVQDVELAPAQAAGAGDQFRGGVLVVGIRTGSPAEAAGVAIGDIVLAVDRRPTPDGAALAEALAQRPDGHLPLLLMRGSVLQDVVVGPDTVARKAA
jgi:S1-C subfamily serine protease